MFSAGSKLACVLKTVPAFICAILKTSLVHFNQGSDLLVQSVYISSDYQGSDHLQFIVSLLKQRAIMMYFVRQIKSFYFHPVTISATRGEKRLNVFSQMIRIFAIFLWGSRLSIYIYRNGVQKKNSRHQTVEMLTAFVLPQDQEDKT